MSGDSPVKAQCVPFRQIPHTTRLFADFLAWAPRVRSFYSRPPQIAGWLQDETSCLRYDATRREQVAGILERQNRTWGAPSKTAENITRLRAGASAAVTGQQVGLFGGPVFSLYKALSAVKLADEATRAGVETVPVFWLATQDHDLAEINYVSVPGQEASRLKLTVATRGSEDAPVGVVRFGPEIEAAVDAAAAALGDTPVVRVLRESYRPGESFGSAFARLYARLFADWGVILLDAADPELNAVAEPVYRAAIEHAAELDGALAERGRALDDAGYHQQVKVNPESSLLFVLRNGARTVVQRETVGSRTSFAAGAENWSEQELLARIGDAPQDFSPNVLLRPVVQDYLLPTLAYTGGAAEVAYFAQAGIVYQKLLGRVTPIVPRFSATLIEPRLQSLLERYGLALTDVFQGPEAVREQLASKALSQELQAAFDAAATSLENSLARIRDALAGLDKTLVDSAKGASEKMQHQLEQLRSRAARAELRQTEVLGRHAELLSAALYPEKMLQERAVAGVHFLARYGDALLQDVYRCIHTDCLDHQAVSL
jgi:bacillithiol synthase